MRITMNRAGFIFLIIISFLTLATCQFRGCKQQTSLITPTDTLFLNQWRREKAEKLFLIKEYKSQLTGLQKRNDSLHSLVTTDKKIISALRFKARYFERQLRQALSDTSRSYIKETILLDSLVLTQNRNDTACDNTIVTLEKIIDNRDSAIVFHQQIEFNLKEANRQQELNSVYLTERLNDALREGKRSERQKKLLTVGVLVLSGISTTLLIGYNLK